MRLIGNTVAATALLGTLAMAPAACSVVSSNAEAPFHQTAPAAPMLEIHNTAGSVDVVPWNDPSIRIEAIRRGPSVSDAQAIAIEVRREGSTLVVRADFGESIGNRNVFFTIHAPPKTALNVDETAGTVDVRAWTGSLDVSQTAGNVSVDMARLDAPQHLTIHTVTGNVDLTLPSASNATVDASATVGSVSSGFPLNVQRQNLTGASGDGSIGRGGAPVELRVTTGAISIHRRSR